MHDLNTVQLTGTISELGPTMTTTAAGALAEACADGHTPTG